MFSWASLGPVVAVEQTLNAPEYLNVIADQFHPHTASVFSTGNGMFQWDNAPCQKTWIVLDWFQEYDTELQLVVWSSNSPDLNPMEHIWMSWNGSSEFKYHQVAKFRIWMTVALTSCTICLWPSTKDIYCPWQGRLQGCFRSMWSNSLLTDDNNVLVLQCK